MKIQLWMCIDVFYWKNVQALMLITPFLGMSSTYNTKLYINVIALNDYQDIVSLDSGTNEFNITIIYCHEAVIISIIWDCKINWFSGNSYPVGSKRRGVERCIYANGWWTLEATIEQGFLDIRGNKEGTFPVTHD